MSRIWSKPSERLPRINALLLLKVESKEGLCELCGRYMRVNERMLWALCTPFYAFTEIEEPFKWRYPPEGFSIEEKIKGEK